MRRLKVGDRIIINETCSVKKWIGREGNVAYYDSMDTIWINLDHDVDSKGSGDRWFKRSSLSLVPKNGIENLFDNISYD